MIQHFLHESYLLTGHELNKQMNNRYGPSTARGAFKYIIQLFKGVNIQMNNRYGPCTAQDAFKCIIQLFKGLNKQMNNRSGP